MTLSEAIEMRNELAEELAAQFPGFFQKWDSVEVSDWLIVSEWVTVCGNATDA